MTTSDGAKPTGNKKKKPAEPRASERAYLLIELGQSLDDAETKRAPKGFNVPLRLGNDLSTPIGRECERTRKYFMGWLRQQAVRGDHIGALAAALLEHEAVTDGQEPPDSWVKLKSRIGRALIRDSVLGPGELRAAVEEAKAEFNGTILRHEREAEKGPAEFAEAAE